jgi:hypothetical protein
MKRMLERHLEVPADFLPTDQLLADR